MILVVYTHKFSKNIFLPVTDRPEYRILLNKDLYNLDKDISLKFEINAGKWFLKSDIDYMLRQDQNKDYILLEQGIEFDVIPKNGLGSLVTCMIVNIEKSFVPLKKYRVPSNLVIGKDKNQSQLIYDFKGYVSHKHCLLSKQDGKTIVKDLGSTNATFLNGKRIQSNHDYILSFGDKIQIFGLKIIFWGEMICIDSLYGKIDLQAAHHESCLTEYEYAEKIEPPASIGTADYERENPRLSCREILKVHTGKIAIVPPSDFPEIRFAGELSVGTSRAKFEKIERERRRGSKISFFYPRSARGMDRASYIREDSDYNAYLNSIEEELKSLHGENNDIMERIYPSALTLCQNFERDEYLWPKKLNVDYEDHTLRLGRSDIPFQIDIQIEKEKFMMGPKSFKEKVYQLKDSFSTLHNVPVGIDFLKNPLWGFVSKNKSGMFQVIHSLIMQLVLNYCYTDLKLAFCYDNLCDEITDLSYLRWFPHIWSKSKSYRYFASKKEECKKVFFELAQIMRFRKESGIQKKYLPHYVLFVDDPNLLQQEPIANYIFDTENFGLTTIILTDSYDNLPGECTDIVAIEVKGPDISQENNFEMTAAENRRDDQTDFFHPHTVRGPDSTLCANNDTSEKKLWGTINNSKSAQRNQPVLLDQFDPLKGVNERCDTRLKQAYFSGNPCASAEVHYVSEIAIKLANVHVCENNLDSEISSVVSFFDMYNLLCPQDIDVKELWRKCRPYDGLYAFIGKKAGNKNCLLNIHRNFHGPHGVIVGTTGSGKTELLQTLILSLAINYGPQDVNFLILDFKGGMMGEPFLGLPHTIGCIFNFPKNEDRVIERVSLGIKKEIRRRQSILKKYNNNIDYYTKYNKLEGKNKPLPHLIIIIDEFHELIACDHNFAKEMTRIATIGGGLGIHLILSTQKPKGAIYDQIFANVNFKVCFKVLTLSESENVLGSKDAARITHPGRGYAQIGNNELYYLFQGGFSSKPFMMEERKRAKIADIISNTGERLVESIERYQNEATELKAMISYLKLSGEEYPKLKKPWTESLPDEILLRERDKFYLHVKASGQSSQSSKSLNAIAGKYEDFQNQSHHLLTIDFFKRGNIAVLGNVQNDKSNLMQVLMYSLIKTYNPAEVQFYIFDFTVKGSWSSFQPFPHTGTVFYGTITEETIENFFKKFRKELEMRRGQLDGIKFSEYIKGNDVPALIILIDKFDDFYNKFRDKYEDDLLALIDGAADLGIFFVVSADKLPINTEDKFETVLCLKMHDPIYYLGALKVKEINKYIYPDKPGRGLVRIDGKIMEFQTALIEKNDRKQKSLLGDLAKKINSDWKGVRPDPVRSLSQNPSYSIFYTDDYRYEFEEKISENKSLPFGFSYDTSIYSIDLNKTYCYLIEGKIKTGKTNAMKILISNALLKKTGAGIFILDSLDEKLSCFQEVESDKKKSGACTKNQLFYTSPVCGIGRESCAKDDMLETVLYIDKIFETRFKSKQNQNLSPVFIFIADLLDFCRTVYKSQSPKMKQIKEIFEKVICNARYLNIYFFASYCVNQNGKFDTSILDYEFAERYISNEPKNGIHLGGVINDVSNFPIFKGRKIQGKEDYTSRYDEIKHGTGIVLMSDNHLAEQVVIPLY